MFRTRSPRMAPKHRDEPARVAFATSASSGRRPQRGSKTVSCSPPCRRIGPGGRDADRTINSSTSGNLSSGGADFYEIEPGADGRLLALTSSRRRRSRAPALALRFPGQPARSKRRPVGR